MPARPDTYVAVTGLKEVDSALFLFSDRVRKQLLRAAAKEVAAQIKADAQARAPRKDQGRIAEAIQVRALQRNRRSRKGDVGASVRVGDGWFRGNTFFAGFLEFGTKPRFNKKSSRFVGLIKAATFWFLRPALYAAKPMARIAFAAGLRKAIAESADKTPTSVRVLEQRRANAVLKRLGLNE